ncbi:MAG: VWA domain-containing protein, partial [Vicinamibacterales bacterium]
HMLTYALGEHARYADWSEHSLADALDGFATEAALACETHDDRPPPDVPGGCEHIDILFVIDGSVSMAEEQAALRGDDGEPAVFAEFTDALLEQSDTLVDVRVGVISAAPGDTELHTHHDQPAEPVSTFTSCGIEGSPWLVAPSLGFAEQFACLASTRAESTEETPVLNAVLALEDPKNAGFVREDSLLVVVILTDEDTQDDAAPMTELRERMLAAVDGDVQRLVMLAIAGDPGVFEMPKTTCFGPYGTATPGRRIHSVLASLGDHGILQDICAGELATTFADVLGDVVDACADYHPEG